MLMQPGRDEHPETVGDGSFFAFIEKPPKDFTDTNMFSLIAQDEGPDAEQGDIQEDSLTGL